MTTEIAVPIGATANEPAVRNARYGGISERTTRKSRNCICDSSLQMIPNAASAYLPRLWACISTTRRTALRMKPSGC